MESTFLNSCNVKWKKVHLYMKIFNMSNTICQCFNFISCFCNKKLSIFQNILQLIYLLSFYKFVFGFQLYIQDIVLPSSSNKDNRINRLQDYSSSRRSMKSSYSENRPALRQTEDVSGKSEEKHISRDMLYFL